MKTKFLLTIIMLSTNLFANMVVATSILPQAGLIKTIGGDKITVVNMIPAGASPHSYEPKPIQMAGISKAKVYFTIGVEFEQAWLPRFKSQNQNMIISDTTQGVKKIAMVAHHHAEHDHHEKTKKLDPHIWTTPQNMATMATNIKNTLVTLDPANKVTYMANYSKLLNSLKQTDLQIKTILKNTPKGSKFMIFHPAWGYFASQYGLIQIPIELEGKEPKPKELMMLIKEAKEENIKAIFVAPEFSSKSASQISKATNIQVVKISNLMENYNSYMIGFAKAVANQR